MNIMTYIVPVSMKPKHYIIALYHGTKSLENWEVTHSGTLQMLAPEHAKLVLTLGKKSGKTFDKLASLQKKWLLQSDGLISGIAARIELEEIAPLWFYEGDHSLFLCRVVESKSFHENILTTKILEEQHIIL